MAVKPDLVQLSEHSALTASDVNALVKSNVKLIQVLEHINDNLAPLKELKHECADIRTILSTELVDEIVRRAVVDKQLDITSEHSTLSVYIKEQTSLLQVILSKLSKAIWTLIICVTLLGGTSIINNWVLDPHMEKNEIQTTIPHISPVYKFDQAGRAFIISRLGDTLWVVPKRPDK